MREAIVENKTTNVQVFNYILNLSDSDTKAKVKKRFSSMKVKTGSSQSKDLRALYKSSRSCKSASRVRLDPIKEDTVEE